MTGRELLLSAARGVRGDLLIGSVFAAVHQSAEAAVPVVIGATIDHAVDGGSASTMLLWVAILAALFVCLSTAGCTWIYRYERVGLRVDHDVRVRIARRALDPRGTRASTRAGELVSLASVDSQRVAEGVAAVVLLTGAIAGTLGAAAFLLATSLPLGLTILVGLPLVLLAVRALAQPLQRRSAEQHEATAVAAGVATDLLTGLRVVKGLGAERAGAERYRVASRGALDGALRAASVEGAYAGVTVSLSGLFLVVVAGVGGRLALDGSISIGELISAVGITQFLVGPLTGLVGCGAEFARAAGSAGRVAALVSMPVAVAEGATSLPGVRGALALRDVAHGSLAGADLAIAAGETVGVVAEDPADAAALVALLARTVDPERGEVLLDGVALRELTLACARGAVLVEPHDADLFEGTLRENIAPGGEEPRADALAAAAADDVVGGLPEGLGAELGEQGRSLSGGQRQRVALARALQPDPPVLVLHEPTTAVDAATEFRIATRLAELRRARTTVLVTTSPALLAVASRIVVLRAGRVDAEGTHDELCARDAAYREAVLA